MKAKHSYQLILSLMKALLYYEIRRLVNNVFMRTNFLSTMKCIIQWRME